MLTRQLRSEWMRGNGRPLEKYASVIVLVLGTLIPIIMILVSSRNALMRKSALETPQECCHLGSQMGQGSRMEQGYPNRLCRGGQAALLHNLPPRSPSVDHVGR